MSGAIIASLIAVTALLGTGLIFAFLAFDEWRAETRRDPDRPHPDHPANPDRWP
ncbi:hypothetical protein [Actinocorallia sp. A-T 12471]|uniref:hypothetical protein n=1 Tax=Actinocorallia sp. A-T 12471 TaxID=3089813 RepID=UPI0029D3A312|nr:hypothetical protein [Actinocorallia sp. A-T 12471]MDX6743448.1 hypothetical protein [Actinocorallia sp. A-T 12471]